MVATNFLAICPLLPTPQIISLPLSPWLVIASTAKLNPPRATGSVSYNRVKHERAVASVPRTCTALERRWLAEVRLSRISGGVIDIKSSGGGDNSRSHGVTGDGGEGGDGGGMDGAWEEFKR